jgi:transcriptional regulator with XRE-family HTH domain
MELSEFRKGLGLSQAECAKALGLKSKGYICEIEKSKRAPLVLAFKIERWTGGKVKAASLNPAAAEIARGRAA